MKILNHEVHPMSIPQYPSVDALLPAVEQCPVSVVITNREGVIEYVNPWFTKTCGYQREEVVGKNPRILKSGVTTTSEYAGMYATLLRREVWRGEFCNRRRDGTLFWEQVVMVPVLTPEGEITHFMALKEDVTAQKNAERSETSMMTLLRLCNEAGSREELMQGVADLFQWRASAARARVVLDVAGVSAPVVFTQGTLGDEDVPAQTQIFPLYHKSEHLGRIELEFSSPKAVSDSEQINLRQMASTVAVALAKFAEEDARLKAEQRSREAQKMDALGQLAGGIAHDYNNILTATLLHLALAREMSDLPVKIRGTLAELESEAKRVARLTRQLLLFSRRQLGCFERVDMRTVVDQLLTMLRRVIGEHVTLEFADGPGGTWIQGDTSMVEQVIVNLCINARDALGTKGGHIHLKVLPVQLPVGYGGRIRTGDPTAYVCLAVSDSGCGMDAATKARLFEPFFTTKEPGHGTGLGLATVYGIVDRHHGFIECDSEVGVGTEFRVFFPRKEAPCAAPQTTLSQPPIAGVKPLVLLIEDEPMVRAMSASALRLHGCDVVDVPDGKAALSMWSRIGDKVHLIMADLVLPGGMSGRDVIERCRQMRRDLPAILTSGHFDRHTDALAQGLANVTFLPKPFEYTALVDIVSKELSNQSMRGRET